MSVTFFIIAVVGCIKSLVLFCFNIISRIRVYSINKTRIPISISPVPVIKQVGLTDFVELLVDKVDMLGSLLHD